MPIMLNKSLAQYNTIGVVGIGQTGVSVVRYLLAQEVEPVIFDTREQPANLVALTELRDGLEVHLGPLDPVLLLQMDILVVSPGVDLRLPELQLAADAEIPLIGDIDIFARLATKPVIGITGSNGKSTVTRLTAALLEAAGKRVAVAGNIGVPVLDVVANDADYDVYVLELSSFQLELMQNLSLTAATVLNVSDDHMDRYYTRRDYVDAKQRIYQNARCAVWNREEQATEPMSMAPRQHFTFGLDASETERPHLFGIGLVDGDATVEFMGEALATASELQLAGMHNLMNVQAALGLVYAIGIEPQQVLAAVKSFKGLPHRCETVLELGGVTWVNDSKATNIGAAEAAIFGVRRLVPGKLILLAGGDAKGADFKAFRNALDQIDVLITFGRDADRVSQNFAQERPHVRVKDLPEAIHVAAKQATPGSMVLLSPACASLDMFRNYEDRGNQFRQAVEAYHD